MTDLSRPMPQVSATKAESLAKRVFGLPSTASLLNSERDRKYRLKTETNAGWILKIRKSTEPLVESEFLTALLHLMARLIERGHRRIALVIPLLRLTYATVRLKSYQTAPEAAGIAIDPQLITHGHLTPTFGRQCVLTMSALATPPTACICANEASGLGALSGFHERGLVHGPDAVIYATDDLNVSHYFSPPITTFYLPISKPSSTLGAFILRRMAGEPAETLQQLFIPDLMERWDDRLAAPSALVNFRGPAYVVI